MNPNILDDEHESSFLVEMRRVEIWLSILAAFGFILGVFLFFAASEALRDVSLGVFLLGIMLIVQMGLVFYWSNIAYQYTRAVKWYNPEHISTRLEHLLEHNGRLWRATGLGFLWFLATIVYAFFGGFMG